MKSVSEITIKNLTQERDSAVSQLSVAYFTTEQLKAENARLCAENTSLHNDLTQLRNSIGNQDCESTRRQEASRKKNEQQIQASQDAPQGEDCDRVSTSKRFERDGVPGDQSNRVANGDENRRSQMSELKNSERATKPSRVHEDNGERKHKKTRVIVEEYSESEASDGSVNGLNFVAHQINTDSGLLPRYNGPPEATDNTTGDITFLSFLEVSHCPRFISVSDMSQSGEIAKLRRTLEQERMARKKRLGQSSKPTKPVEDVSQQIRTEATAPLPRKLSMKDLTGRPGKNVDNFQHEPDLVSLTELDYKTGADTFLDTALEDVNDPQSTTF